MINKEQVAVLLLKQQEKGRELLSLLSTMHERQNNFGDGMAMFGGESLYYVPDNELNNFKNKFQEWKSYVSELLVSLFGSEDQFVSDWNKYVFLYISKRNPILPQLAKCVNIGLSNLNSFIQRLDFRLAEENTEDMNNEMKVKKRPMVFISHNSEDIEIVRPLVDLLESIGLDKRNLFCSSIPGLWLELNLNIFDSLRRLFEEHDLFVIFIQSPRYYKSAISLNEMGAAWILRTYCCSILTSDMSFENMRGVFDKNMIALKVNTEDASYRLNELKSQLLSFLGLPDVDSSKWERKRNEFLSKAVSIDYTERNDSLIASSISEEHLKLEISKLKEEAIEHNKADIRGNVIKGLKPGMRELRIFNAGKNTARNVRIESLVKLDKVKFIGDFSNLGDITPQNYRAFPLHLVTGCPDVLQFQYTWDDDYQANNTKQESLQL